MSGYWSDDDGFVVDDICEDEVYEEPVTGIIFAPHTPITVALPDLDKIRDDQHQKTGREMLGVQKRLEAVIAKTMRCVKEAQQMTQYLKSNRPKSFGEKTHSDSKEDEIVLTTQTSRRRQLEKQKASSLSAEQELVLRRLCLSTNCYVLLSDIKKMKKLKNNGEYPVNKTRLPKAKVATCLVQYEVLNVTKTQLTPVLPLLGKLKNNEEYRANKTKLKDATCLDVTHTQLTPVRPLLEKLNNNEEYRVSKTNLPKAKDATCLDVTLTKLTPDLPLLEKLKKNEEYHVNNTKLKDATCLDVTQTQLTPVRPLLKKLKNNEEYRVSKTNLPKAKDATCLDVTLTKLTPDLPLLEKLKKNEEYHVNNTKLKDATCLDVTQTQLTPVRPLLKKLKNNEEYSVGKRNLPKAKDATCLGVTQTPLTPIIPLLTLDIVQESLCEYLKERINMKKHRRASNGSTTYGNLKNHVFKNMSETSRDKKRYEKFGIVTKKFDVKPSSESSSRGHIKISELEGDNNKTTPAVLNCNTRKCLPMATIIDHHNSTTHYWMRNRHSEQKSQLTSNKKRANKLDWGFSIQDRSSKSLWSSSSASESFWTGKRKTKIDWECKNLT